MRSRPRPEVFTSLRFRLTLVYAAAFAVSLALVFLFQAALLRRAAVRQTDNQIAAEANRLLDLAGRRKARIMQAELDRFALHYGADAVHAALFSPWGDSIAASDGAAWPPSWTNAPAAQAKPRFFHERVPGGPRIRTVWLSGPAGHAIRLSRSIATLDRELRHSGRMLLAAFAASLVLGTLLAYGLTHGAMARVDRVRRAAVAIANGDLSRRLPAASGADEIGALSEAFNTMIEKLAAALDELRMVTDSMAHDFRTPLTRMRAAAETALSIEETPDERRDTLACIVEECDRLERMSAMMLQIVRLDAGAAQPARAPLRLEAIAREAIDLFEPAAEDKGVVLAAGTMEANLDVLGDRPMLERVVTNLLDNAIKYTPAGGRVTVAATRAGGDAQLAVTDTGIGMTDDERGRIFDRFYRSDHSRSTPGAGLGLSFVQSAVRAHGGRVAVTSRAGEGSTFTVILPSAPAA